MTELETVCQSDLVHQIVIDRATTEELGRVEVLWMYPPAHRVLGFVCKSGLLGNKKSAFKLDDIEAIGGSGVLVRSRGQATTADRVKRLESLMQHEVWSERGDRLGKITDCLFNLRTGQITHYLFASGELPGIMGEVYQIAPSQIVSVGKKRVLIYDIAADQLELYQESLPRKVSKAGEAFKEEAVQEWRSISQRAKERFQGLTEQAKERAQTWNERLREEAQLLAERAREQSQELAEQVKEQTQTIGRQVEEGFQTLTVHAEEIFEATDRSTPARDKADVEDEFDFENDFDFEDDFEDEEEFNPKVNSPSPANQPESQANQAGNQSESDEWDDEWGDEWDVKSNVKPDAAVTPERPPIPDLQPLSSPKTDLADDDDDEPWI